MLTSSKTYDIIRETGFISLPSKRTLRDYTHWIRLKPDVSAELFNYLQKSQSKQSCRVAKVVAKYYSYMNIL